MRRRVNTKAFTPDQLRFVKAVAQEAADRTSKSIARSVAKDAATTACLETLAALGFKVDTAEARAEIVVDAKFIRRLRIAAETNPAKYGFALFTTLLTVTGALMVFAAQQFFGPFFSR